MKRLTKGDFIDTWEIYKKLMILEDIEEELGIELTTLIQASKSIVIKDHNGNICTAIYPQIDLFHKCLLLKSRYNITYGIFPFDEYGKTWASTKEELK